MSEHRPHLSGPLVLPGHLPDACPFGHSFHGPEAMFKISFFPCQCPSAVEHKASEEAEGRSLGPAGHYYIWCQRCRLEHPHRDTTFYEPPCPLAEQPRPGPPFRPPGTPDGCRCRSAG